jgi:hypothetical protein
MILKYAGWAIVKSPRSWYVLACTRSGNFGTNISQEELDIDPTAYATRWYLTLFNLSIPFPAQLRLWDVFMLLGSSPAESSSSSAPETKGLGQDTPASQGLEILHATALAIIDCHRESLLDSDFENAMKSLTSFVPIKEVERFIGVVRAEWKQHQSKYNKT